MKKVSIIVPVYNSEKYLKRCIDSLLEQSYGDYEIICIDDCSLDGSLDILNEYKKEYPDKLKVIANEENHGQGRSRMKGVAISDGEYITFVDSDDYVSPSYIKRFMYEEKVNNYKYDVVIAGFTKDRAGKFKRFNVIDDEWSLLTYPLAACKLYKKSFLTDNGIDFSSIRNGEDIFFSLSVYACNPVYKIIKYHGYYYFDNSQSTTRTLTEDKRLEKSVTDMFDVFMERYDISLLPEDKRRRIEYSYATQMINALITYGHGCGKKIMNEKYEYFINDYNKRFPDYKNNPYFGFRRPKVSMKIWLGTNVTMILNKIKLDRFMFSLISHI